MALLANLACAHAAPPVPTPTNCLSPSALAETGPIVAASIAAPAIKKLDPELRSLLRRIVRATPDESACFPETVDVLFEFRGDRADLERAGLIIFTVRKHPDGRFLGTGRLPTGVNARICTSCRATSFATVATEH